ncbi:MAG: hypothetical protein K2X77_01060 [Candidatus Obscuribacterales bacterium]|jgi:hypothetical protein|nr:hypothetical protein [Candidatus Obscuribacterales bacterium]
MRKANRSLGQALPFTLAATLLISIAGVAIVQYIQMLNGSQEHNNATDAGMLNLNKKAVVESVSFDSNSSFQSQFKVCSATKNVDLGSYNNMVSTALLIAMNASADGSDPGIKNAESIVKELQGTKQSVGAKLKELLENPEASEHWAKRNFDALAKSNSIRMTDKNEKIDWDGGLYKVAYLESAKEDVGASNVAIEKILDNMPYTAGENDPAGKPLDTNKVINLVATDGLDKYVRGYQPISLPGLSCPIYTVPTQPKHQPHLVSKKTFSELKYSAQPGKEKVFLPPNGFQGGARSVNDISKGEQMNSSAGIVGIPTAPTEARIPQGYLVIDNSMRDPNFKVHVKHNDTWEACEAGTGTLVHRKTHIFSTSSTVKGQPYNALESWLQTPASLRPSAVNPNAGPPITDDEDHPLLYDASGAPITSKLDASRLIPYDTDTSHVVVATDRNSDPDGNNPDSDCSFLATPSLPDNMSPFNRAYHPNVNSQDQSEYSGQNLIAAEQAKLWTLHLYPIPFNPQSLTKFDRNFGFTGLRLYPNSTLPVLGGPYTYAPAGAKLPMGDSGVVGYGDPNVLAKVTTNGTIEELFKQTTGTPEKAPYLRIDGDTKQSRMVIHSQQLTPSDEVKRFIVQRMKEIKPEAGQSDFDKVFNHKVALGEKLYVYLQNPANPKSEFVLSETAPSWALAPERSKPDGKMHAFCTTYPIGNPSGSMIDSPNDFGIHDHLFMTNKVNAFALDTVSYQASSGANGLLGYIKFFQFVKASGALTAPHNPE